jgi:hypothetical protein
LPIAIAVPRTDRTLAAAGALPHLTRRPPRRVVVLTPAHDAFLGTASDTALADAWDIETESVYYRRRLLCIPGFGDHGRLKPWTPMMIASLRTMLDRQIAQKFHMNVTAVAIKRRELRSSTRARRHNAITWTLAMLKDLGTVFDRELARRFGLATVTVSTKRQELGMPRLRPTVVDWPRHASAAASARLPMRRSPSA